MNTTDTVTIHHLADTHYPLDDGRLAAYVASLGQGGSSLPDLIVHGGDLVNGADNEAGLRAQLTAAKAILDRSAAPVRFLCHSHDRFGDPTGAAGKSFADIIGQPFLQHVSLTGLEIYLLSGSVTFPLDYHPGGVCDPNPPSWGFDIFDPQVLALFDRFVAAHPGRGGRRVLFTHHPVVPFDDLIASAHPDAALVRPYHVVGADSRPRIIATLRRAGIEFVCGGHCHFHSRNIVDGIEFVTTPSFLRERGGRTYPVGFGVLTWDGASLSYAIQPLTARPPLSP